MCLHTCEIQGKAGVYTRVLLRESFRENGKVENHALAYLSRCSPEEIAPTRLGLDPFNEAPKGNSSRITDHRLFPFTPPPNPKK